MGCGPYNGYVQYAIFAPSSGDPSDIQVVPWRGVTEVGVHH